MKMKMKMKKKKYLVEYSKRHKNRTVESATALVVVVAAFFREHLFGNVPLLKCVPRVAWHGACFRFDCRCRCCLTFWRVFLVVAIIFVFI